AVGDRVFQTWDGMQMALLPHALDRENVDLRVRDAGGHERVRELELSALPEGLDERSVLSGIGLTARQALLPPVVGTVRPDSPAWGMLAENDRITAIDGQPVEYFDDIGPMIQALGSQGGEAMVEVEREGQRLALPI